MQRPKGEKVFTLSLLLQTKAGRDENPVPRNISRRLDASLNPVACQNATYRLRSRLSGILLATQLAGSTTSRNT